LGQTSLTGSILAKKYKSSLPSWITHIPMNLNLNSRILEVGSGAGDKLLELRHGGLRHLTGIDPFIQSGINYGEHVRIRKGFVEDITETFDFVMLHHSFEHMPQPREAFKKLKTLVPTGRFILIRVPVSNCYAWKKYGVNWVQLDAPRHFFLHTPRSLGLLAEEAGLEMVATVYDSRGFQLWGSEQYLRDIPLKDPRSPFCNPEGQTLFSQEELAAFAARARELNENGEGDQACFYFRKK